MIELTTEAVLELHAQMIAKTGGADGVRDTNSLDSAIKSSFQTFGGADLYSSIEEKTTNIGFSLIQNHPFLDGNKRTAIAAMIAFLAINGIELNCDNEGLIELGLGLAKHSFNREYLYNWVVQHT